MTFAGHAIPASFFLGFGIYVLCLTLYRARQERVPLSRFIPERNVRVLRSNGLVIIVATLLGMTYEEVAGLRIHQPLRHILHLVLYLAFTIVAVVLLLESRRRLPPDSHRIALTVAFGVEYVLWSEHASMKSGVDQKTHEILGQICGVSALTTIFSICVPSNVIAFVAGWALMIVQALWLFTLGFCDTGSCFRADRVGSYFCLEVLIVTLILVVVTACVYKGENRQQHNVVIGKETNDKSRGEEEYQSLALSED